MSFATLAALLVGLLVAAPVAAHLLRRRRAEEQPFPAARLVPASPPTARRRSLLEDRALFSIRALAIAALAVLGATPFVSCSHLALARKDGASVALAIVVDDSLSMRAPQDGGPARPGAATRFDRAVAAARELTRELGAGDAVALVLAGDPARVALASTTNMAAVAATLATLEPSDRATDLDGALRLAEDLVSGLPQSDKRIVLLSDLADGQPDGPPLASLGPVRTWVPLPELEAKGADCAVTRADRAGSRVTARVVCTAPHAEGGEGPAKGRSLVLRGPEGDLRSAPLRDDLRADDVVLEVPRGAPEDGLIVALTGSDSIAEDDIAPVVAAGGALPIAVIVDHAASRVETGGAPPVEQALAALELGVAVRPLPAVPEHRDELDAFAGIVIDDAPGFTPEVRRALAGWVERGGVLLATLGPRAAAAPLGASFDPLVPGVIRWSASPASGVEPASAPLLGASAASLAALEPTGRTTLEPSAVEGADLLGRWTDGAPWLVRRRMGRGAVLALTLPLGTTESDLALRPAFLALLDGFVDLARARGGARRIDVGRAFSLDGYESATVELRTRGGKAVPVPLARTEGRLHATPPRAGLYDLVLDGERTTRVAAVAEREIDLRPRRVAETARSAALGGTSASIDASPYVALALLALLAAELFLRTAGQRRREVVA